MSTTALPPKPSANTAVAICRVGWIAVVGATFAMAVQRSDSDGPYQEIDSGQGFVCREREVGTGVANFEARLTQYRQGDTPMGDYSKTPRVELEVRRLDVPYLISGTIDKILTPVRSSELDALLKQWVYKVGNHSVYMSTENLTGGAAEGTAFGVILEFRLSGTLMARQRVWWDGTPPADGEPYQQGIEWLPVDPEPPSSKHPWNAVPEQRWTITVGSDPETALRVIDRDRYWEGEVQIPLQVEPPRAKWLR